MIVHCTKICLFTEHRSVVVNNGSDFDAAPFEHERVINVVVQTLADVKRFLGR